MKGLETAHNGYKFRSRTEARWAVFFETLGVDYLYEPQGFNLGRDLNYLPDFYLPSIQGGLWGEVKAGPALEGDDRKKVMEFVHQTQRELVVLFGDPAPWTEVDRGKFMVTQLWYITAGSGVYKDVDEEMRYGWCVCPGCGEVGLAEYGSAFGLCCGCDGAELGFTAYREERGLAANVDLCTADHPEILKAVKCARSERFGVHSP